MSAFKAICTSISSIIIEWWDNFLNSLPPTPMWNEAKADMIKVGMHTGQYAKDTSLQIYRCLTEWENHDEDTRSYDFRMDDVTLGIKYPNKNK